MEAYGGQSWPCSAIGNSAAPRLPPPDTHPPSAQQSGTVAPPFLSSRERPRKRPQSVVTPVKKKKATHKGFLQCTHRWLCHRVGRKRKMEGCRGELLRGNGISRDEIILQNPAFGCSPAITTTLIAAAKILFQQKQKQHNEVCGCMCA